ncbi:MAG: hypothetical protein RIB80_04650 [Rhodospirillales bacterium]
MDDDATPTTGPDSEAAPETPRNLSLLAAQKYGGNFHGTPSEDDSETAEPDPDNAAAEAETDDGGADEGEDVAPDEGADDEDAEAEAADEADEQDSDDEAPISSLSELIESQDWDEDWFNGLKVPVKVNGAPAEATVADLVANYQMGEAAEQRLEDAKARAKIIIEDAQQQQESLQHQFAIADRLIKHAEQSIDQEYAEIRTLREDDPAEYAARKADLDDRKADLEKMKADAVADFKDAQAGNAEKSQAELQEYLEQQQTELLQRIPEWKDPKTAEKESAAVTQDLLSRGFTQNDINQALDAKLIDLARDAWLGRQLREKKSAAKKKVAKAPKVMKPGAPKPQEQRNQERTRAAQDRLKQSGSIHDAVAALQAKRGTGP